MTILDLSNQDLTTLPSIAEGVTELYCQGNKLTKLSKLPKTLKIIDCSDNQIEELPRLHEGLIRIDYKGNKVKKLPNVPWSLKSFLNRHNRFPKMNKLCK